MNGPVYDRYGGYADHDRYLGSRQERPAEYNTRIRRDGTDIVVRYHNTDILRFLRNGDIIVHDGGWQTVTTAKRINRALYSRGARVYSKKYRWYLHRIGWEGDTIFFSGARIRTDGTMEG